MFEDLLGVEYELLINPYLIHIETLNQAPRLKIDVAVEAVIAPTTTAAIPAINCESIYSFARVIGRAQDQDSQS